MVSLCKDEIHKSFCLMQTQEWARCLQRLRVHQIAHKLTDNNDKIEQNPCPVPAGSQCECEYVRVKQLNLDLCWHSCDLQFTWLGTYSRMSRLIIISQFLVDGSSLSLSGVRSFYPAVTIVTGSWLAAPSLSLCHSHCYHNRCQNISQASVKSSHDTQPALITLIYNIGWV